MVAPTEDSGSDFIVQTHRLQRPLSSPGFFDQVLGHSGDAKASKYLRLNNLQKGLLGLALICLMLGGYFSYVGIKTVKLSTLQAANISKVASQINKGSTTNGNVSPNSLSSAKVTTGMLASYQVGPNAPRYLFIPKLHVDSRVLQVGLSSDGSISTPVDVYDTAWYQGSAEPGQPGAAVIDGHVASWTGPGVFAGLKNLQSGDSMQVVRGDGRVLNYDVVKVVIYQVKSINMEAVLSPVVSNQPGLNLISCTGSVDPSTSQYNQRVVVFSKQV